MKRAGHTLNLKNPKSRGSFFAYLFSIHCERTCMLTDRFEMQALGKLMQYKSMKVITEDHTNGFPRSARTGDTFSENWFMLFTSHFSYFLSLSSIIPGILVLTPL